MRNRKPTNASGTIMSLARKIKRQYERETRKRDMVELYQHMDLATARLERNYKEAQIAEDAKNMTVAMYFLFGLALHKVYGFGALRLMRVFEMVDKEIGSWRRGEVTAAQLQKRLYDETGVDLQL